MILENRRGVTGSRPSASYLKMKKKIKDTFDHRPSRTRKHFRGFKISKSLYLGDFFFQSIFPNTKREIKHM